MSLISCHLLHVTHVMSHHCVTHLMSHHYVTHLMSHHYGTDTKLLPISSRVATFNFCLWPLPTTHRIILPVTSAPPFNSNLCQPRSVLLPSKIGIVFQGVFHSSQSRSHVTNLMSRSHVTHLSSHHYVTDTKLLPIYSRVAKFNFCPWPLPNSPRIILPVTSAHPLHSNLCPPRSVILPRRIGIKFKGVSHSSQSRSHVTHPMSHHFVTQPGLNG